ncbi:hypothetical protein BIW11_03918 [Tropilaelaps mercedesae]|uniref:Uncharacterized protein n=1 Tax=Tropilaelaps mercedesae TaxID=418985 RepID=A0A1V9XE35_9ACAR|nr:hypothetical protein BIW11_03918 [Tropilaelaps mercedesae]
MTYRVSLSWPSVGWRVVAEETRRVIIVFLENQFVF